MLMLQKYFKLPINKGPVFYKYKKIIREIRQEVYKERQKEKKEKKGDDGV